MMDDLDTELEDGFTLVNSLNEEKKKPKLPLAQPVFCETQKESGYHRSTRMCLQKTREAMLHHRWQEAAKYMCSYLQAIEDTTTSLAKQHTEVIWRTGTEILHHLPQAKMEHYNSFYEHMKILGLHNHILISLEHSFHLLVNGHVEDGKHQLSVAEGWRFGRFSEGQAQTTKLIQAYRSLLDYIVWCDKRTAFPSQAGNEEMARMEMEAVYRKSTVNLKEILNNPGVWDPFILGYVDMLDYYEQHEEASKVLGDYAYDSSFPPNPNAHVYLYRHLKKHNAPEKKLRRVLKNLNRHVPSHELMLDYVALLLQSDKEDDFQVALEVSLEMLDYACWKSDLDAWESLKSAIDKVQIRYPDRWKDVVSEKMASRNDWWPAFHFTPFHVEDDLSTSPELLKVKTLLSELLFPDNHMRYRDGCWTPKKTKRKNTSIEPPEKRYKLRDRDSTGKMSKPGYVISAVYSTVRT